VGTAESAFGQAREVLRTATFRLEVSGATQARATARGLLAQIEDYLLPRSRRSDAPLLAVVGGSTGAGKSTLVNSLVRAPVSRTGVLRPTTRSPLLVSHPTDASWFAGTAVLPSLRRSNMGAGRTLQVVNAPALTGGLALVDAPDFDSVEAGNRVLARQLLAAADLWLFVTSAARYADAVPWRMLHQGRQRGTVLAIVLDRVPAGQREPIATHLRALLAEHRLGDAPLFVVDETTLDGQGLLAPDQVAPVRDFIDRIAASPTRRRAVSERTLRGALAATVTSLIDLARAADDQVSTASALTHSVLSAFASARARVAERLSGTTLVRGEVHARWVALLGGERVIRSLRDIHWDPDAVTALRTACAATLVDLITDARGRAHAQTRDVWLRNRAGRALLIGGGEVGTGLRDAESAGGEPVGRGVADWLADLSDVTGVLAMVATLAGSDRVSELRALTGNPVLRERAGQARAELLRRIDTLFDAEMSRYLAVLVVDPGQGGRLRRVAELIRAATQPARTAAFSDAA
jgi:hypothetical protein